MNSSVVDAHAAAHPHATTFSSAHPPRTATQAPGRFGAAALRAAAVLWFAVTAAGQLIFAGYIAGFYGRVTLAGRPELWNKVMPHGYVSGDTFFNLVLGVHLIFAFVITLGGLLQLVPAIRRRVPALHRWTGRAYLVAAAIMAAGGLLMIWFRGGAPGDFAGNVIISFNALLILACAAAAWRYARSRRVDFHRRWALRLFVAVSGVWFFRVGLMFWIAVNRGPVGFDPETFTGPALIVLGLAAYLLPQGMVGLYFLAQQGRNARAKIAMAGGLTFLSLTMAVGVVAAAAIMWLPRM